MEGNSGGDAARDDSTPKSKSRSEGAGRGLKARPSLQLFQSPAQRAQRAALQRSRGAAGALISPSRAGRLPAVSLGHGALGAARGRGRLSLNKARTLTKKASLEQAAISRGREDAVSAAGSPLDPQQQPEAGASKQAGGALDIHSHGRKPASPFRGLNSLRAAPAVKAETPSNLEQIRKAALSGRARVSSPTGEDAAATTGPVSPAFSMWRPSSMGINAAPLTNETATSEPERGSQSSGGGGTDIQVSAAGVFAVPAFTAPASSLTFGSTVSSAANSSSMFGNATVSASTGLTGKFGDGMPLNGPFAMPTASAGITFGLSACNSAPSIATGNVPTSSTASMLFGGFGGFGSFGAANSASMMSVREGASSPAFGSGFLGASGGFGSFGGSPLSAATSSAPAVGAAAAETPARSASPVVFGLGGGAGIGGAQAALPSDFGSRAGSAFGSIGTLGLSRSVTALHERAARFAELDTTSDVEAEAVPSAVRVDRSASGDLTGVNAMDMDGEGVARGTIMGTCTLMCPEAERSFRERMRDIDSFERSAEGGPPDLAVKKFARNVEQVSSNFRTMETLQRTQSHLLALMNRHDVPLARIHHFLWDRCRGVRQDLFVQGYENEQAIGMYEEHVRFMILAEVELAGYAGDNFNSHLNLEQINKACISLNEMYDNARARGTPMPNEAEFRAYHLLTLMGTHGKYEYNPAEFLQALKGCEPVRNHPSIVRVMQMRRWLASGAWALFLRKALDAPYLQAALAHLYFRAVRAHALKVMAHNVDGPAQNAKTFRLEHLQQELLLDSLEQAQQLCEALDVEIMFGPQGPLAMLPRGFAPSSRELPDLRSELISSKGRELRSDDVAEQTVPAMWGGQDRSDAQQQLPALASPSQELMTQQPLPDGQARNAAQQHQEEQARRAVEWQAELALRREAEKVAAAEGARQEQARREASEAAAAARTEAERKTRAEEEARRMAKLQRQQEEEQQRRAAEEAARVQELEARRLRAEQERQELERQQREEAARLAAEAAERRRQELERLQREAAERARRAAEEAEARRRREEEQRRQEAARQAFVAKRKQRIAKAALANWLAAVVEARETRRQEERRLQSLAACRIGLLHRPPAKQRPSLTPPRARSPPKKKRRDPNFQDGNLASPAGVSLRVATALGQGLVQSNPGLRLFFFKLLLLRTPAKLGDSAGIPAAWLQRAVSSGTLAQGQAEREAGSVVRHGLLATQSYDVAPEGEPPVILAAAIRDASHVSRPADLEAAAASASGLLLLLDQTDDPGDVSPRLHALVQALPARSKPCLPLLVLVVGEGLVQPVTSWLHEELSAGLQLRDTHVLALPEGLAQGVSTQESEEVLLEGLTWLAQSTRQPSQAPAACLADIAQQQLEVSLAALPITGQSPPGSLISAFNGALRAAATQLQAAASLAAAQRGWPPEDCLTADANPAFPAGWWQADGIHRQQQLLLALALPPFTTKPDASLDDFVQDYIADDAKVALNSSPSSRQPWRQALLDTFQVQLSSLETVYPAIVLPMPAAALPTASAISDISPAPLPISSWVKDDARPLPKRKWSRAIPQVEATIDSVPKVPRYAAGSPGRSGVAERVARVGAERRKSAGDTCILARTQDLFAGLEVQSNAAKADGASEKMRGEAERHTAWLEHLLQNSMSDLVTTMREETSESNGVFSVEIQRSSALTKRLLDLKGGF